MRIFGRYESHADMRTTAKVTMRVRVLLKANNPLRYVNTRSRDVNKCYRYVKCHVLVLICEWFALVCESPPRYVNLFILVWDIPDRC